MKLRPRDLPLLVAAIVLVTAFAAGALRYDHFASVAVVRNLLVDNAFLGVAAVGATFVILSGGIDLSVGAVMAFTGVVVAALVERGGVHPGIAIAIALALGAAFGLLQGAIIRGFALPAFLVTLAGMFLARGMAFAVEPQSRPIRHPFVATTLNESATIALPLGETSTTIPLTVSIGAVTFVVAWFVLRQTPFGRRVYAIGDDLQGATVLGLPVAATTIAVYAISGFLSALAGVVFVLYQQAGDPTACKGLELDAIAAVVIGGTLLRGGVGSVVGTLIGVLIYGLIQTIITFEGTLSSWWTRIVVGALILAFVAAQRGLERVGRRLADA
ncbi:MAG: sugar ABC transporter permease YjfF [Phycisphaerae bacterium]|nr:sugar ABC transporter permease YjfF [Phycisphaerae bacterium]